MTADLITFLRARLDEDEAVARAVEDRSAPLTGQWEADGETALRTANDHVLAHLPEGRPFKPGVLPHIARHDPARTLAEVEAKRKAIHIYEQAAHSLGASVPGTPPHDLMTGAANTARAILQALATAYADHPDYREE
ncbi:DUF6221 family protein [Streptomyces sp. WAC00276]|uniref:DUF6221 family protein n=1 Tax=Streptomyces sp. WAC00276 TaxID=2933778 RepID=UPI001FFF1E19|nr:DUF6221 family protein [Streptomyces sp. WAC00276]MCK2144874.1 DUF6221 family protein [Streptomyces sp. WAC00276]